MSPAATASSAPVIKESNVVPPVDMLARRTKFEGAWKLIRDELLEHFGKEGMPKEATEWYQRNLDYNVPGGKLNRGMSVVDSVEIIKGRVLTHDEFVKAAVLGWCVELLQAYFLVVDDIMDSSVTRRSQPCWYRAPAVGMIAINDSLMLGAAIYHLLKLHFRGESYYVDLLERFHETTYRTEMGQLVDLITAPGGEVDLTRFSLEKHRLIVVYKTAYYSFDLPIALAMHMCHIPESYVSKSSPSSTIYPYTLASNILLPLGVYFQVQDDFLDYAGTPEQIGKVGTDVVDNKCSWCINTALAVASPIQRQILEENYGKKAEDGTIGEEERRVKEVYEAVGLKERYAEYEDRAYGRILGLIERIPEEEAGQDGVLRREVFMSFLEKIHKRTK